MINAKFVAVLLEGNVCVCVQLVIVCHHQQVIYYERMCTFSVHQGDHIPTMRSTFHLHMKSIHSLSELISPAASQGRWGSAGAHPSCHRAKARVTAPDMSPVHRRAT